MAGERHLGTRPQYIGDRKTGPHRLRGRIDLLCLDSAGDTVIVELKKGQTPREVTAQALDYASWVRELSRERLADIADEHFGKPNSLDTAFQEQFEKPLPDELNLDHRSLVVAESMDASTGRIVRYLSSLNVPINVATIQHFKDQEDRSFLAQVYLIEPEEAEAKSRTVSKRAGIGTVNGLQALAEANGHRRIVRSTEKWRPGHSVRPTLHKQGLVPDTTRRRRHANGPHC